MLEQLDPASQQRRQEACEHMAGSRRRKLMGSRATLSEGDGNVPDQLDAMRERDL